MKRATYLIQEIYARHPLLLFEVTLYNTYIRRGYLSKEAPAKSPSPTFDRAHAAPIAKIFVVCDQKDPALVSGYILRQWGLSVILETSIERALDRWSAEMPDLVDFYVKNNNDMELYKKFRAVSVAPILLFLPAHHEMQILEAYEAGVDEMVVKPSSRPIFLAKIMAWVRRSWIVPTEGLSLVNTGMYRLDPARLSRILIAVCRAYFWMICQGLQVIAASQTAWIDRTERIDKTLFRLGPHQMRFEASP
jgi:CheY-like chemotaxis protein